MKERSPKWFPVVAALAITLGFFSKLFSEYLDQYSDGLGRYYDDLAYLFLALIVFFFFSLFNGKNSS